MMYLFIHIHVIQIEKTDSLFLDSASIIYTHYFNVLFSPLANSLVWRSANMGSAQSLFIFCKCKIAIVWIKHVHCIYLVDFQLFCFYKHWM